MECWLDRRASQRAHAPKPETIDIGSAVDACLGNLKVIPNWRDVAIRKARGEYENAMRYGDEADQLRAQAQLERAMKAAGLE
jgi:hypothetical protein